MTNYFNFYKNIFELFHFLPKRSLSNNINSMSFKHCHSETLVTFFKELNVRRVQVVVSLKQLFAWRGKVNILFNSYIYVINFPSCKP